MSLRIGSGRRAVIQSTPSISRNSSIWVWVIIPAVAHHHKLLDAEALLHFFYLRQQRLGSPVLPSKTDTDTGMPRSLVSRP